MDWFCRRREQTGAARALLMQRTKGEGDGGGGEGGVKGTRRRTAGSQQWAAGILVSSWERSRWCWCGEANDGAMEQWSSRWTLVLRVKPKRAISTGHTGATTSQPR
jgi:hypothetical protein